MKEETNVKPLQLTVENIVDKKQDESITSAIKKAIEKDDTIDTLWNDLKDCHFDNHIVGRGGNHIWIKNSKDLKTRVAIISY